MKKLFTPFLLLGLLLVSAQAYSYDLYVNGIQVTDSNKDNITGSGISGGKISYVPSYKQLRISDGTVITVSSSAPNNHAIDNGIEGLVICFDGTVTIKTWAGSAYAGIFCRKDTHIGGWSGVKAIVSVLSAGSAPAICSYNGAKIELGAIQLITTSTYNNAIFARGSGSPALEIDNTKLTTTSGNGYAGITGFTGGIELTSSELAQGQMVSGGTVVDASGNVVKKVMTYPHVMIGDLIVDVGADYLSEHVTGANSASGRATYAVHEKRLWLENVKVDGASLNIYAPDLTVILSGECSISTSSIPFYANGNISLTGDGSLTVTSTGNSGVYVNGAYDFSINIPRFSAGGAANYYGVNAGSGTLTVNKYSDDCLYKFAGGKANVYARNLVMNDMDISTPNSYWNASDRYVYKKDEIARAVELSSGTWFKATSQISYYDLWVAGARVKTNNTQYIHGPYLTSGTVTYDASANKLTMDGTTINVTGDTGEENCVIYSKIKDLTINATGTNSWKSEFISMNLGGGGTTSITGSGTLYVTSSQNIALNTFVTTNLTLRRSGGTMEVKGKTYGFNGRPNTTLSIYKDGSGALYKFAGETANIGGIPTLYLGGGVHISTAYQWFNEEQQAVYSRNIRASSSSPTSASATWIRSDLSWVDYPIYIAGTQLYGTSNGSMGFWNKYVKGGNIYYDNSTKTLTLDNASIDYTAGSSTNDGIITTNRGTTLDVKVVGNNTLEGSTPYAGLWFNYSTVTFSGSGTLSVPGGTRDNVYGLNGSTITVKGDVTLEAPTYGIGSNNPAEKLIVAGNAVVKARQISCLNNLTLQDDRGIIAPARAKFNASNRRVEVDGMLARDVVIGKLETYDLYIADTQVTNANCSDIIGKGIFSYDNSTKTLTINGDFTYSSVTTSTVALIESRIQDLTIDVASNSTLAIDCTNAAGTYNILLYASATITGGTLTLEHSGNGYPFGILITRGNLTFDQAQVLVKDDFVSGITSSKTSGNVYLYIKKSDIVVMADGGQGAIYDWDGIELEDCWVVEPYPSQVLSYGIADGNGNIVGRGSEGTVVITSDRSIYDGIPAVSEAAETVPSEVYDLSGRKLDQPRQGVNIVLGKDGKARKVLRK